MRYRWIRRPRTTQERRVGAWRAKRARLPTHYDDLPRCVQRSWKVHRPYRWREPRDIAVYF
jgi:hypothetical protein